MKTLLFISLILNIVLVARSYHSPKVSIIHNDQVQTKQASTKKIINSKSITKLRKETECPPTKSKDLSQLSEAEWEEKIQEISHRFDNELEEHFVSHNIDLTKLAEYKKLKMEFEHQQSEIWKSTDQTDDSIFSPYREKNLADLRIKYMKKLKSTLGNGDYETVHNFIENFNKLQLENQEKEPSTPVILINF